jgi:hypothetical protein
MQDHSDNVVDGDPTDVLLAVADPATQTNSCHWKLARYQRIVAINDYTKSGVHDPDASFRGRGACGLPLDRHVSKKPIPRL